MSNNLLANIIDFTIGDKAKGDLPFAESVAEGGTTGGTTVITNILGTLLSASAVIAMLVLLVNLILAALEWLSAGGESSKIEKAKTRITQSITGVVVLFSAVAIFVAVQGFLGMELISFEQSASSVPNGQAEPSDSSIVFKIGDQASNIIPFADQATATSVAELIGMLLSASLTIAGLVLFFQLIYSAIEWISAGGDSSKIQKAKDRITQSIIGLTILVSAIAIFLFIQNFLDIKIIKFRFPFSGGGGGGGKPGDYLVM